MKPSSHSPQTATGRRGEGETNLAVAEVEVVKLVVTQHGREVAPRRVAHDDLTVLTHADQSAAIQHLQPLR